MFGIVLLALTVLVGLAFDWISFSTSPGRIVVSINYGKLMPMLRKLRDVAFDRLRGRDSISQHHSRD